MEKNQAFIQFNDVSLRFRIYTDKGMSMKEAIINSIRKKQYDEKMKEFWVLKNLNVTIRQGDRLGIIGNNGAGKSTMLKLISKIYEPTEGPSTSRAALCR